MAWLAGRGGYNPIYRCSLYSEPKHITAEPEWSHSDRSHDLFSIVRELEQQPPTLVQGLHRVARSLTLTPVTVLHVNTLAPAGLLAVY